MPLHSIKYRRVNTLKMLLNCFLDMARNKEKKKSCSIFEVSKWTNLKSVYNKYWLDVNGIMIDIKSIKY